MKRILTWLTLACTAACGGSLAAPLVGLRVEVGTDALLVHVRIDNPARQAVYVQGALASDGELEGPLFDITEADSGAPIAYQGMLVKRGPLALEDFVRVDAHGSVHHSIDITRAYAFLPGRHRYQLRLRAVYLPDPAQLALPLALEAPPVSFSK